MPTSSGTVHVRIWGEHGYSIGAFGISYSTGTTRPTLPVNFPTSAITLTENQWMDGEITNTVTELWYSFPVTTGQTYRIWWNARLGGDGSKTLEESGSAWYADGREIFIGASSTFNNPRSFTPDSSGAVYVRTRGRSSSSGTFGIVYSTGTTKPATNLPAETIILAENQWMDGNIQGGSRFWYSFPVTAGQTYRIWWNGWSGDGSKTAQVAGSAWYADGKEIFSDILSGFFSDPRQSFTPTSSSTVYVMMHEQYWNPGTFALVYSTGSTRPITVKLPPSDAITLTENQWMDSEMSQTIDELWYSFPVTAGHTYRIWWNDGFQGDGSKTLRATGSAWYADGKEIFIRAISTFNNPRTFTPDSSGTVYVRVLGEYASSRGTFAVVYGSDIIRPGVGNARVSDARAW